MLIKIDAFQNQVAEVDLLVNLIAAQEPMMVKEVVLHQLMPMEEQTTMDLQVQVGTIMMMEDLRLQLLTLVILMMVPLPFQMQEAAAAMMMELQLYHLTKRNQRKIKLILEII